MCGITAFAKKDGYIDQRQFREFTRLLYQRGPDEEGFYFDNYVALGHRRLSIIDLKLGRQPIFNEDGTIGVIFNGEIYNYQDIKRDLEKKGHRFKTNTDGEVLVHLFEEYEHKLSEYIEGMFVFVIYNKNNKTITISRDHFGKKPIYYYWDNSLFLVSSEMKVLLQVPEIKKNIEIDRTAQIKYLFYGYVPSPNTIFAKIKKLEPSTTLQFSIDKWGMVHKYQYWDLLRENEVLKNLSEEEILKKIDHLIKSAVKKRLMADVPLGAFLSGGVDSSLVCAIAKKFKPDLETFTVSYPNSEVDESSYAQRVAEYIGVKSNFCYFRDQNVLSTFKEILDYLDEPMADAAIIPTYFLSKFARQKAKVVLSGDGGDELFGGYSKYRAQKYAEIINRFPSSTKMIFLLSNIIKFLPIKQKDVYLKFLEGLNYEFGVRNFIWGSGGFLPAEVKKLLKIKRLNMNEIFKEALNYESQFHQKDIINKAMYLDCKIQLPDWYLVKTDRATMATSLEMRNPLLDKELSEFVFTLSSKYKVGYNYTKYLLKKLASRYVPKEVIYREKKGFAVPLNIWFKTVLKNFAEELLKNNECEEYFDKDYVRQLWSEHIAGEKDNAFKILRIVNFVYFVRKWL